MFVAVVLQIQAMAAMQDEFGPKSVTVLVTWVDGQVHFEVRSWLVQHAVLACVSELPWGHLGLLSIWVLQCSAHAGFEAHSTMPVGS